MFFFSIFAGSASGSGKTEIVEQTERGKRKEGKTRCPKQTQRGTSGRERSKTS